MTSDTNTPALPAIKRPGSISISQPKWPTFSAIKAPAAGTEYQAYDVVGPVCESGDTFAKGRALAPLKAGDLIAFRSAGAYGAVMASEYNTRPLVPEVMVKGDQFAVIRPRPSLEDIINRDIIPQWH